MFRQVSSRNQRSKGGLKARNVLQVCILVAVSVWLVYQMKHSQYKKKAYEERAKDSTKFKEDQLEITKFGRKDLPRTLETDPLKEFHNEVDKKEDAKVVEQGIKHEEINGGGGDHKMDAQGIDRATHNEQGAHGDERYGQARETSDLVDQEHQERSHESQEKTFTGDDASSEVVHNSIIAREGGEHEERSHEAQEKSFKDDDVSSAVDHVTQLKEPEPENGVIRYLDEKSAEDTDKKDGGGTEGIADDMLEDLEGSNSSIIEPVDTSKETDSTVTHEEDETLLKSNITTNEIAIKERGSEVVMTKLAEVSPSNAIPSDSENHIEHHPDLNKVYVFMNHTEIQTHSTNELDNQIAVPVSSTDRSKDQINQTMVVDPTANIASQNQSGTLRALQDRNITIEVEIPGEYKSERIENKEKPDTTAQDQNVTVKEIPGEHRSNIENHML